jgi:two-component system chemotaxis response regulator CheB
VNTPLPPTVVSESPRIGVMVCDDSSIIRGTFSRLLEEEPDFEVRASLPNGTLALRTLENVPPDQPIDVILLDIEMPMMDGLTALPHLLAIDPSVQIIIASAISPEQGRSSLKAINLGAKDFIPKPRNMRDADSLDAFRQQLVSRVRELGRSRRRLLGLPLPLLRQEANRKSTAAPPPSQTATTIPTRNRPLTRPQALAIGCSTGGPQALLSVLKALPYDRQLPLFVTQHMPATFTKIFAEQLSKSTAWPCDEATDGQSVSGGRIYMAPGDWHMLIQASSSGPHIALTRDPPENFCRPAVDPMLRSLSAVYGRGLLAVILTGMGSDGEKGCRIVAEAGGAVIAQDEATSVVWGMPGAAARSGVCSAVLPLPEIAPTLGRLLRGGAL